MRLLGFFFNLTIVQSLYQHRIQIARRNLAYATIYNASQNIKPSDDVNQYLLDEHYLTACTNYIKEKATVKGMREALNEIHINAVIQDWCFDNIVHHNQLVLVGPPLHHLKREKQAYVIDDGKVHVVKRERTTNLIPISSDLTNMISSLEQGGWKQSEFTEFVFFETANYLIIKDFEKVIDKIPFNTRLLFSFNKMHEDNARLLVWMASNHMRCIRNTKLSSDLVHRKQLFTSESNFHDSHLIVAIKQA